MTHIKNAPKHISAVQTDLQEFDRLLGTLQTILEESGSQGETIESAMSGNLSQVLNSCIESFEVLSVIVTECETRQSRKRTKGVKRVLKRVKWNYKEKEVENARRDLAQSKLTPNTAVSLAIWYLSRSYNVRQKLIDLGIAQVLRMQLWLDYSAALRQWKQVCYIIKRRWLAWSKNFNQSCLT